MTPILSSNLTHLLHHTFYKPKGDIKAALLIVHGMSEHGGRYAKFAQFLADHGVFVGVFDQLGHGKTAKSSHELGFFGTDHPIQTLCKDVIIMADKLKELTPNVPQFILGNSMGSFIVRLVLTHHAHRFHGAILMGAGDRVGALGVIATPALTVLNRFYPTLKNKRLAWLLNDSLLSQLRSPVSSSPFAWLSENTDNIKAFESDPLCGFAFTNNGFFTLNALVKKACRGEWLTQIPKDYAILLISGKDDPVGSMGADVPRLHDKLIAIGADVTSRLYVNMRHEPLQETNHCMVFGDVLAWLIRHTHA
ncbi:lysophospholipase [Moraxella nasovis]|uniref:alpha/beta fold hydrolase n=1 Tax=Moraxella nasovis TaxID=2904121 RepID=UPI001F60888E|nr:alpha/beta fold hydrolase [Moraxella nasovis]UNU73811.1 lysophospholipase [Moraxella nasovis]